MDRRITEISIRDMLSALADLAMPRACVVCGRSLLPSERDICLGCLMDLPLTHFEDMRCNPMADRFNAGIEDAGAPHGERYCFCTALFYYSGRDGYSQITQALKYRRNFSAGKSFGAMLGQRLVGSGFFEDVDMIVPVPLHWSRRFRRGYNQAEVIARSIAEVYAAEKKEAAICNLLVRNRRTRSQAHVGVSGKAANVAGAFSVRKGFRGPAPSHILIVDDVFTTGATTLSCYLALRGLFGPEVRISVAALGVVGHA